MRRAGCQLKANTRKFFPAQAGTKAQSSLSPDLGKLGGGAGFPKGPGTPLETRGIGAWERAAQPLG